MLRILVVDDLGERRADLVDALCELPGVEVCGTAADGATMLAQLRRGRCDVIVATAELRSPPIAALIDLACARALDVIVVARPRALLPGIAAYWHDLGARAVVHTPAELLASVRALAERRRASARTDDVTDAPAPVPMPSLRAFTARAGAAIARGADGNDDARSPAARASVSLPTLLGEALPRWANLIPPDVEVQLVTSRDVPLAVARPQDIERIALHLVLDACAALPLGGTVWLCIERAGTRHVRLEVLDSSGRHRAPAAALDALRVLARRHAGELRAIELGGGAMSVVLTLPAVLAATS